MSPSGTAVSVLTELVSSRSACARSWAGSTQQDAVLSPMMGAPLLPPASSDAVTREVVGEPCCWMCCCWRRWGRPQQHSALVRAGAPHPAPPRAFPSKADYRTFNKTHYGHPSAVSNLLIFCDRYLCARDEPTTCHGKAEQLRPVQGKVVCPESRHEPSPPLWTGSPPHPEVTSRGRR